VKEKGRDEKAGPLTDIFRFFDRHRWIEHESATVAARDCPKKCPLEIYFFKYCLHKVNTAFI